MAGCVRAFVNDRAHAYTGGPDHAQKESRGRAYAKLTSLPHPHCAPGPTSSKKRCTGRPDVSSLEAGTVWSLRMTALSVALRVGIGTEVHEEDAEGVMRITVQSTGPGKRAKLYANELRNLPGRVGTGGGKIKKADAGAQLVVRGALVREGGTLTPSLSRLRAKDVSGLQSGRLKLGPGIAVSDQMKGTVGEKKTNLASICGVLCEF
ncbi:hypothetical protein V8E53_007648 [Lactarius tabidus]